nr:hypothetical protein [Tanacetum cinerariifolium]
MTLTFADTHNMIAYLTKSDASEGFNQIYDFLNGSSIKYALTVNPNIYVSRVKQFWTSVAGKKVNDVTRLQALVDKKKVIITEDTIRDSLCLDDAEGVECLPNEEIFNEVENLEHDKIAQALEITKLKQRVKKLKRRNKASKLKRLKKVGTSQRIETSDDTVMDDVSKKGRMIVYMDADVDVTLKDVAAKDVQHAKMEESADVQGRQAKSKSQIYQIDLEHANKVDKGATKVNVEDVSTAGVAAEGDVNAADDVVPTAIEEPSISSPTLPTQPSQPSQDQPSTSQVQLTLPHSPQAQPQSPQHQSQPSQDAALEITKLKQRVKKLKRRNKASKLKRLKKVGTSQRIETSDDTVMDDVSKKGRMIVYMDADVDVTLKDVAAKDVQHAKMEESADVQGRQAKSKSQIYQIDLEHANKKEDKAVKRYQALKRKPQTEAQARKNMMIYLRNVAGFKMNYFKGMNHDDIHLIFEKKFNSNVAFLLKTNEQMDKEDSRALKRLSESQDDTIAKKQKLDETSSDSAK